MMQIPHCVLCGAVLPWPGVQFSVAEQKAWKIIYKDEKGVTREELARMMKLNRNTVAVLIHRINNKIRPKGLIINNRPYRVVSILGYRGT